MRYSTRNHQAVFDNNPSIVVNPKITARGNGGVSPEETSICFRCFEMFSPTTWAHLRGETLDPPIPAVDGATSDYHIMNDLDFCVKMFNAGETPKKRGPMLDFKIPAKEILTAAEKGCAFCSMVTRIDEDGLLAKNRNEVVVLRLQAFWPKKAHGCLLPMIMEVGIHDSISGGGRARPIAFVDEHQGTEDDDSDAAEDSVGAMRAMLQQASSWLQDCERNHPTCRRDTNNTVPSRLLDLSPFFDSDRVNLVSTAGLDECEYAAFSYVWGTNPSTRLVEANEAEFRNGIAYDDLPPSIGQAVEVASQLGIQYLWVDALCILQDSAEDKAKEIPHMNDYYRNAHVVISASGAKDVTSGFLRHQSTRRTLIAELRDEGSRFHFFTGGKPLRIPGHFDDSSRPLLVHPNPPLYAYSEEPTNKRAWCLQESILPRRLVAFPRVGGIAMKCLENEQCGGEILSDPFDEIPAFGSYKARSATSADDLSGLWNKMVEDYVQRSITHRSDILVAIGALARSFHSQHEAAMGRYLGGLWESHLRSGLLWHNTNAEPTAPQGECFAPSWSWAACPSRTVFRNEPEFWVPSPHESESYRSMFVPRWYCEIKDIEITPRSKLDPYGAIDRGVITMQAPLRPLRRTPPKGVRDTTRGAKSRQCPDLFLEESFGAAEALLLDRLLPEPLGPTGSTAPSGSDSGRRKSWQVWKKSSKAPEEQYYWLGIWYAGRGRGRGLVVRETLEEGTFERLGFAEFMLDQNDLPSSELHKERIIRLV